MLTAAFLAHPTADAGQMLELVAQLMADGLGRVVLYMGGVVGVHVSAQ